MPSTDSERTLRPVGLEETTDGASNGTPKPAVIYPRNEWIVCRRIKATHPTLALPDGAAQYLEEYEVVAIGPGGRDRHENAVPIGNLVVGDRVLVQGGGFAIRDRLTGDELVLVPDVAVMATYTGSLELA